MIIRLYYLLFFIIEGIIYLQYCSTIFECQRPRFQRYASIIALYSLLFFISFLNTPLLNILSFVFVNFVFLSVIYRPKWHIALFNAALSTAVMCLGELIMILVTPYTITYSFRNWSEFRIWIVPAVFGKILYFFILHLFGHFSNIYNSKSARSYRSIVLLTIVPIVSIFITFSFLCLCADSLLSSSLAWMASISALLLLILNLVIWESYNYTLEKNTEMMDLQLSLQKESDTVEYYKMLIQQTEFQSQLIHDTKKHLQSLLLLNEKGEKEKITSYIESLICSSAMQSSAQICDNDLLNAILCRYVTQCHNLDISLHIDIRSGVCRFLRDDDMTSLFCNLLDNAVESASKVPNSILELSASERKGSAFTVITLTNSCRQNPFLSMSRKLPTTKSDKSHHGYGLRIIERIVKRYDGEMQYYYSEETHTFHTIITLKDAL